MADTGPRLRRLVTRGLTGAAALLLIAGFVWFVNQMMSLKSTKPERKVQSVQIIRPPPPPPPPPEQPPPPPEKVEQPLPQEKPDQPPEDQPDQQPPDTLANDGPATAGGDAFGMHQGSGGSFIGGNGTAPFAWYTNRMRDAIKDRLAASPCVKSAKGSISTRVTLGSDGHVKQIKLTTTTGNPRVDECVDKALASISNVGADAPPGMPESVSLKVVF
jgi:periplasmic protein TonB